MKRFFSLIFVILGWFAIIMQYTLMCNNSELALPEMTIRFFSYFTILTNIIVAYYFTLQLFRNSEKTENSGIITAITVYILVVGLIYQLILRSAWNPLGMQKIVDELLHSIIPFLALLYWIFIANKKNLSYKLIPKWTIYPLLYLVFILIRGSFAGFYPYPFVDVVKFGYLQVFINSLYILIFFIVLSVVFIIVGKALSRQQN
ncbi:Pr6Pr family membrane protein [Chryseobacterium sp. 2R14A]|uniref:Pr6Pr family membrane protein n=1 Tax=Chryseobacterium sp. 2R14A TaxID=3380353 RepID=UPI003CF2F901